MAHDYSDMGHSFYLKSTDDIPKNKRQGHATLPFLKIDMRHFGSPLKGPSHRPSPIHRLRLKLLEELLRETVEPTGGSRTTSQLRTSGCHGNARAGR